jgi:hypothetical protein
VITATGLLQAYHVQPVPTVQAHHVTINATGTYFQQSSEEILIQDRKTAQHMFLPGS